MIELAIPEPTPLLNTLLRMHWAKRRKLAEHWALMAMASLGPQRPATPLSRVRVEVDRYSAGSPDTDGLWGSVKPLLDALLPRSKRHPFGLGVIADDNPGCLAQLEVRALPAKRGQGRTVVRIIPLDAELRAAA